MTATFDVVIPRLSLGITPTFDVVIPRLSLSLGMTPPSDVVIPRLSLGMTPTFDVVTPRLSLGMTPTFDVVTPRLSCGITATFDVVIPLLATSWETGAASAVRENPARASAVNVKRIVGIVSVARCKYVYRGGGGNVLVARFVNATAQARVCVCVCIDGIARARRINECIELVYVQKERGFVLSSWDGGAMQRSRAAKSVGTEIPGEWGRGWVSVMKRFRVRMGRGGQGLWRGCKKYVMGGLGVSRFMESAK